MLEQPKRCTTPHFKLFVTLSQSKIVINIVWKPITLIVLRTTVDGVISHALMRTYAYMFSAFRYLYT